MKGTVEKLVFGGKGLLRHEGKVCFVPDVCDGEEVEVAITKAKKSYSEATLLNVLTPSPKRVLPKCPYFGTCGGCQLQHLLYEEQLVQKEKWLKESLERIGKITLTVPLTIHPNHTPYGYRHKIILHARMQKGVMALGYYSRTLEVFQVLSCPIFIDAPCDLFEKLQHFFQGKSAAFEADIRVLRGQDQSLFLHIFFQEGMPTGARELLEIGYPVLLQDRKRSVGQEPFFELEVDGISCFYSPRVFIQNDPIAFTEIYKAILLKIEPFSTVLELYSGVGIFSLLGARSGLKMAGIELNQEAVHLAQKSAKKSEIQGVSFYADAAEHAAKHVALEEYAIWVVNPPRIGLSSEMKETILKLQPKQLFYISCEPSTLARDLNTLASHYSIESIDLYDMFSQTTHFETVVMLRCIQ